MKDRLERAAYLAEVLLEELEREVIDQPELPVIGFLRDETAKLTQHLWTTHREYYAEADDADR